MNPIAEEILMHYGMPRRSGRYPWGSGENPYQHSGDFLSRIDELKSQGMSDTEIAKAMGLTTTQYRTQKSLAKDERRALDVARAKSLREDGLSLNEIAKEMGFANDSSVRSLLNENSEVRMNQAKTTAEFIKKQIDEKGYLIPYALDGRRLVKVGVNFDKETRNIGEYIVKQFLAVHHPLFDDAQLHADTNDICQRREPLIIFTVPLPVSVYDVDTHISPYPFLTHQRCQHHRVCPVFGQYFAITHGKRRQFVG